MTPALFFSILAVISYAALAVFVFRRGLHVRVNQLFAMYLAGMLLWQASYMVVSLSKTNDMALLGYRMAAATAPAQFILFCFFARALLRIRERPITILLGVLIWLATAMTSLTDRAHFIIGVHLDTDTGLLVPEYGPLFILIAVSNIGFIGFGLASLVRGYRQAATDMERNRLRYLLIAIVIILLGTSANMVPALVGYPIDVIANILSASIFAYAILRYQLLDMALVVRRGLAYTILTAAIAVFYLLSIFVFERLLQTAVGGWAFAIAIGIAMLAALLVRPWRERVQAGVDRLLFRDKYDAARMLRELSRRTTAVIDLETLGGMLLSEICRTMHLERAVLFLREESSGEFFVATQQGLEEKSTLRLRNDHPVVQWLRLSEQPLHGRELDMLPQFRSLWHEEKEALGRLGVQLFVPLAVKGSLVGILAVSARLQGGSLSSDDETTLATLANQTAVAVENAHLFATTKARVAELTALQEAGVRLVSSHSLPAVLQVVVESAIRLLRADEAHVVLYEPGHGLAASCGITAAGAQCTLAPDSAEAYAVERVAHSGKPAVAADLHLAPGLPPDLAQASHIRGSAIYPLRRGAVTAGALAALHCQPHAFSEEELRLLGMLSDHASLAVDNARLLESEQAKRQLADTLREMSRVIGSSLELDLVLELVLEQLQNVASYDCAAIMLLSGDQLDVSNARGLPEGEHFIGRRFAAGQFPLFVRLLEGREPLIINDIKTENPEVQLPEGLQVRALIGVPLVVRGAARGILAMGKVEPGFYRRDDLQNAVAFANQAAIAIENARLYRETIDEKRKTETILRETFSGIVVTDVGLRIRTFNAGAEVITGYRAQDVIGRPLTDVLGPQIAAARSPLGQVIATGERVPPQETVIPAATGTRDILQGAVALHSGNHEPFGYLISFADISRLKEVDRLKTDIVANVSHELRTPLASIKAYTELLLGGVEGDDRSMRDQFLHTIDQQTDRLSQLISDLLNLSRLEAGRFEVRKVRIHLSDLLADVLRMLDVQRRNQEVTIRIDAAEDLPDLAADHEMVTMIVKNLVANAIKYSRPGGEVTVTLRGQAEGLVLQVTDRGIGIPPDAIPHLFQKFYRVKTAREAGIEGTGLGLVLVKQGVEAHGGTVAVESEMGVGSTFTVRLPWK
ncbi:MAG TPA: GAF domain-containing protein [Anaerolineae bacterium]|nr:GAF domain-containing protein [Anaerolineae bacterium]HOQ99133.1 GAF domain-containing protein [Anaerolineae bacterium]HPL27282.1 GAF domain-containing protein [Anaerolineae bacterium]